jgi:hypothetical protein
MSKCNNEAKESNWGSVPDIRFVNMCWPVTSTPLLRNGSVLVTGQHILTIGTKDKILDFTQTREVSRNSSFETISLGG